ncbi:MAG: hypothetical protein M0Q49_02240 [Porticoccaceae bacterium]|nr:hypothetical protein [Porticoccaceae bacterium]
MSVDMSALLDDSEVLVAPLLVQGDPALVITSTQINDDSINVNGLQVRAGAVVQFTLRCQVADRYSIEVLCWTDRAQRVEGRITVDVVQTLFPAP